MKDQDKTKGQLIDELAAMRQRVIELEKSEVESKQREEALYKIEEMFRLFMDYSPIYVFFKDENIRSLQLSKNYEKMLGKPVHELIGKTMDETFPCELAKSMVEDDLRILRESKPIEVEEELNGRFYTTTKFPIIREGKPPLLAGFTIDITQRKRVEEALRKSEEYFRRLTKQSPVPIAIIGDSNEVAFLNERFSATFGYSLDDLPNLGAWWQLAYPDEQYRQEVIATWQEAVERAENEPGDIEPHEYRVMCKDGTIRIVEIFGSRIGNKILVLLNDITERKRVEAALLSAKEDWERTFDAVSDLLAILNTEYQFVRVNKAMAARLGRTPEECIGLTCYSTIHGTNSPPVFCPHKQLIEDGHGHTAEVHEQHLGGHFLISVSPLRDPGGQLLGSVHILHDITESKQMEMALRESEERYSSLFMNSLDAIFLTWPDGKILAANPEACRIFGRSEQELIQVGRKGVVDISDPRLSKALEERNRKGRFRGELTFVRKDGTKFPAEISSAIFKDTHGRLRTSMVIRDITEQKQTEQKLRSLASKLLLAGERERREIAMELHDHIGQTLAASKIKLGALIPKSAVKFKKPLNEIRELIDQAIQYTRSLTFDLSPPVLYELGLEAAIEWLAEKIQKEHGLDIDVQSHSSPGSVDHEIRILLFQIVRELLFNVVKHAKARRIRISVRGDSDQIRIRVKDDGVGFDTSKVQLLSGENDGFGFFSIRERLSYFGGNLKIVSKLQTGTEVTITAPLTPKKSK